MESLARHSDKELLALLSENKKQAERAFAEIYSRYSQRVYAYCLRITGDNDDANDVFQDTFFKFYDKAAENETIDNLPAFLLTIARNLCLNYKRNQKNNIDIDNFSFYTNDDALEEKELRKLIAHALELLDFEDREAFILRQYHQISNIEIAEITKTTVSGVKNRVRRAKDKIRLTLLPYLENMSK